MQGGRRAGLGGRTVTATGLRRDRDERRRRLVLLALVIIMGYALVYQLVFVEGPSYFGDDTVYTYYANLALHGTFSENMDIFSVRLLNIYPIALFYALFGIGKLSSAGWAIVSFLGSIAIAFLLGRELYDEYAGLLAALLLSFFPLLVALSGTPSPNIPEMFLAGLAVLAAVYGVRRNSRGWYFASGASLVAAVLATPESGYIVPVVFAYLLAELLRKKIRVDRTSLFFVAGILIAGASVLLVNYVSCGNPLQTLTVTSAVYSTAGTPAEGIIINTNPYFYFGVMFPYNAIGSLASMLAGHNLGPTAIWNYVFQANYNFAGFFFYAFALCAAYLLLARERRAYVPLLWFAIGFLFLEFGPIYVSLVPFKYLLTHRLERYLTLIAIPLALTVSFAVMSLRERLRKAKHGYLALVPFVLVAFLIVTAIPVEQLLYRR